MRVSNALVTRAITSRLLQQQSALAEAQQRVASGKRVEKMSDDPTAGSTIMQASGQLRGIEQYKRNVDGVGAKLDAEDSALDQLTQIMTRAKELGVATIGANVGADGRMAAAAELDQLIAQAVNIANTKVGDDYLFGGTSTAGTAAPFAIGTDSGGTVRFVPFTEVAGVVTERPPTGQRGVEIAANQRMQGAHDGKSIFLDTGMLASLSELSAAMKGDDPAAMGTAMARLDGAFQKTQAYVGEVGARQNQIDTLRSGLEALETTFTEQKSGLSEVEMEEAITTMLQRQTAYQAAMLASSKVMGLSLTDYVR